MRFVNTLLIASSIVPAFALRRDQHRLQRGPPTRNELTVVSHLSKDFLVPGGAADTIQFADVWAYGNYAYIGSISRDSDGTEGSCSLDSTGVYIIDISDPSNPEKVGFIPAPPNTVNLDVKVKHIKTQRFEGEILAVTNEPCYSGTFMPRVRSNGLAAPTGQGGVAIWDVRYASCSLLS